MSVPMFILTLESRGLMLDLRLNDVRQAIKREGQVSRLALRLNPWLVSGTNQLLIRVRPVPALTATAVASPTAGVPPTEPPSLTVTVERGQQGLVMPSNAKPLLQFSADPAQLAALPADRISTVMQDGFDVMTLPWRALWAELPSAGQPTLPEVYAYLVEYLRALRGHDLDWVVKANRLRTAIMTSSLGLDADRVNAGYARMLNEAPPGAWDLIDEPLISLSQEGGDKVCRVEATGGGPVIRVRGNTTGSGLSLVLARVSGQLWVVG